MIVRWTGTNKMNAVSAIRLSTLAILCQVIGVDSVADNYMTSSCGQTIYETDDAAGSIDSQMAFYYDNFVSCSVTVQVNFGRRILLTFDYLEIEKFGVTCPDYLHVYDGDSVFDQRLSPERGLCGDATPDSYTSQGNMVTFQFVTDADTVDRGFFIVYTSFTEGGLCDGVNDFRCRNGRCIASRLENDWTDNCGDNSDEYGTTARALGFIEKFVALGIGVIIAIVIGVVLLCIACCIGCYCCICKKKSDTNVTTVTAVQPPGTLTTTVTAQQGTAAAAVGQLPPPQPGVLLQHHHVAPMPDQPVTPAYPGAQQQGPYGSQTRVTYHTARPENIGLPNDKQ